MDVDTGIPLAHPKASQRESRPASAQRVTLPFSERRLLLVLGDLLLINAAVLVAMWLWAAIGGHAFDARFVGPRWFWFPALTGVWWFLAWLADLYDVTVAARRIEVMGRIGGVILGFFLLYLAAYFFSPRNRLPRVFILYFSILALVGTVLWRWGYATLFTLPRLRRRVLIVGAGWAGRTLARVLQYKEAANYQVVGFIDDDPALEDGSVSGLPILGTHADLLDVVGARQVDKVIVAITHRVRGELFQALMDCRARNVHVVRMPELYEQLTRRVPVEHVDEGWVLESLNGFTALTRLERAARRVMDVAFGLLGLIGLGVVLPLVALAVRLDDGGPLFYRQVRAGLGGVSFRVFKFRTMRPDAEEDGRPQWAKENDDRVTKIGAFLRKFRLDELPQVLNVLRGEMSVVGPRPERPEFIADLEEQIPFYRTRLVVKPGLTGWAQIHYGYGNSVEDTLVKLQYDLYYVRHRSLRLDLYTILRTVGVVLRGNGM